MCGVMNVEFLIKTVGLGDKILIIKMFNIIIGLNFAACFNFKIC
jgi:hypothetical protein